ncbi:MAG: polymer-forming cytoskeletal protein [Spirochaetales bacterium]|jgi:cytoskeletal protein CcmA (bactofilin family)|nr:polymer-forming cytoskeletal protein [Spirochaetales bacterium]
MSTSYDLEAYQKTESRLGAATSLKGKLKFSTSVRISGKFEGEIDSTGFLYVEYGAEVRADIKAKSIVVGGVIHGNIEADEKIEMLPTGKIYGNVRTTKLKIADGVVFEGKCEMIRRGDLVDVFAAPIQQLKKTIQSV